jgi:hypothetical protein
MSTPSKKKTYPSQTPGARREYYRKNKDKIRAKQNAWREANPEVMAAEAAKAKAKYHELTPDQRKERTLKSVYGITLSEWDAMLAAQGNQCAICGTKAGDKREDWATDHCHCTGKVRSILCSPCNLMLGHARENPDTLSKAIDYLKAHNG